MTQSPPLYTSVYPRVKPERVRLAMSHPAAKPLRSLLELSHELSGRSERLLDDLRPAVVHMVNQSLKQASFSRAEIGAAFAVMNGDLGMPQ